MTYFKNKLLALMLFLILIPPLYWYVTYVDNATSSSAQIDNPHDLKTQIDNTSRPVDLIDAIVLKSRRRTGSSNVFQVGETLVVVAESQFASAYTLEISENSSIVFVKHGEFRGGARVEVEILLSPPTFSAGHTYNVTFRVRAYNEPILEAFLTDSAASNFTVVKVSTKLSLKVEFDGWLHCMKMYANLTTVDGYPITNETVDFLLQFRNRPKPTDGWLPLGSRKTDTTGLAEFAIAFALSDGKYRIKAIHKGNENYGASETVSDDIQVP